MVLSSLQKSEFLSWLFCSCIILGAKIEINEFEQKKSEMNEKIPRTQKLQAITLTSNSH